MIRRSRVNLTQPLNRKHPLNVALATHLPRLPQWTGGSRWADISYRTPGAAITGSYFWRATPYGPGIWFSGVVGSGTATIGNGLALAGTPFTIAIAFNCPAPSTSQGTLFNSTNGNSTRRWLHLRAGSGTTFRFGMYNDDLDVTVADYSGKDTIVHCTLSTGFVQTVYFNGVQVGQRTAGGFGAWDNSYSMPPPNPTTIWSVRCHTRSLSATEVAADYAASLLPAWRDPRLQTFPQRPLYGTQSAVQQQQLMLMGVGW